GSSLLFQSAQLPYRAFCGQVQRRATFILPSKKSISRFALIDFSEFFLQRNSLFFCAYTRFCA
ncbi:MAG: hypothetical protein ACI8V5_002330, partial [Limisphaerales bacterium]